MCSQFLGLTVIVYGRPKTTWMHFFLLCANSWITKCFLVSIFSLPSFVFKMPRFDGECQRDSRKQHACISLYHEHTVKWQTVSLLLLSAYLNLYSPYLGLTVSVYDWSKITSIFCTLGILSNVKQFCILAYLHLCSQSLGLTISAYIWLVKNNMHFCNTTNILLNDKLFLC